jgi:serine/threonine-protein kinase
MELTPGAIVARRYRVDRKIGAGGMGEVWAGEHVAVGVRVALKTLLPAAAFDPQIVARFRREATLLGRLHSDHVARVVDFIEDPQFGLVLVMGFVQGEQLGDVLDARRLGVEEAIDLAVDLAGALCDLHDAKVVHRDLKPDNIILEPRRGGKRRAVILDFGVSRVESDGNSGEEITGITRADMALGTIAYMAPEQFLSSRDVTGAADLYALGAILFRAVTGQHVFGDAQDLDYARNKLHEQAPPLGLPRIDRVARGLTAIVGRALARRPEDRHPSAQVMLEELVALQEIAKAMSFDLDANTEMAPPSGLHDRDEPEFEPTMRMSLPEVAGIGTATTDPFPQAAAPLLPAPAAQLPAPVPLPAAPQLPPSLPPPAKGERRTVALPTAIVGMAIALLAGTLVGVEAYRLIAPQAPPAGARP